MGINQSIFVFLSEGAPRFLAAAPLGSDRATMRLRLRDKNRGHYTSTRVVLHATTRQLYAGWVPVRRCD
jgi:hypothetical protein